MKIIIIDDDPTGSQTLHSCPLLLKWDNYTFSSAFNSGSKLIFILANTRSLSPDFADQRVREVCKSLKEFFSHKNLSLKDFMFISRGDSTLRGHGVLEPDVINAEIGPFDATFHIPSFFEGGRTTKNGLHLLNGLPVHETDFAKDKIFGFSTSHLANWLEEKSAENIKAANVVHIKLSQLENAGISDNAFFELVDLLFSLKANIPVIVDSELPIHLETLVKAIRKVGKEKRFLFRSAASFINALSGIPSFPQPPLDLLDLRAKDNKFKLKPGIVVVGSHVSLADEQLVILLNDNNCKGVEIDVQKIFSLLKDKNKDNLLINYRCKLLKEIKRILFVYKTPVLYTSRGEIVCESQKTRIMLGLEIAEFMACLVGAISEQIGYIISKGGITTQILLEKGLNLKMVELKGQILPGLSIVVSSIYDKKIQFPIITFPGNLGNSETLIEAWKLMENKVNQ